MAHGRGNSDALQGQIHGASPSRREPMTAAEIAAVRAWRARCGGGWQAAATYCGRTVDEVRAALTVQVAAGPRPAVIAPAPEKAVAPSPPTRAETGERERVLILKAVGKTPLSIQVIAAAIQMDELRTRRRVRLMAEAGLLASRPAVASYPALWGLPGADFGPPPFMPKGRTREEWKADCRAMAWSGLSETTPRSIREIAEAGGVSSAFVNGLLKTWVAEGRAAFSGHRKSVRGRPVELWLKVKRDAE